MLQQPELISLAAAARQIGVSLTGFAANCPLEIRWLGRRRYVLRSDFDAFVAQLQRRRNAS